MATCSWSCSWYCSDAFEVKINDMPPTKDLLLSPYTHVVVVVVVVEQLNKKLLPNWRQIIISWTCDDFLVNNN